MSKYTCAYQSTISVFNTPNKSCQNSLDPHLRRRHRSIMCPTHQAWRALALLALSCYPALSSEIEPIVIIDQKAVIGGGSVNNWRTTDLDTALLTGNSGKAVIRIATGETIYGDLFNPETLRLEDYSPEKQRVLERHGQSLKVISLTNGETVSTHPVSQTVYEARFFNDGNHYHATLSNSEIITVDASSGEVDHRFEFPESRPNIIVSGSRNTLYAFDSSSTVRYPKYVRISPRSMRQFDLETGESIPMPSDSSTGGSLFIYRGYILWSDSEDKLFVMNIESGETRTMTTSFGDDRVNLIRIHPNGESLAVLLSPLLNTPEGANLKLFQIDTGIELADLHTQMAASGVEGRLNDFAYAGQDDDLYTFHSGYGLHAWDSSNGSHLGRKLALQLDSPVYLGFSPNGRHLLSLDNGEANLIDIDSGKSIGLYTYQNPILEFEFSPDSRFLFSLSEKGQWRAYHTADGELASSSVDTEGSILSASLMNNGAQVLARFENGTISIYEPTLLEKTATLPVRIPSPFHPIAYAPSSGKFAFAFIYQVEMHDIETNQREFLKTESFVIGQKLQLSSNGERLALIDQAKTHLKVYDTTNDTLLFEQNFSRNDFITAQLSNDGSTIVLILRTYDQQPQNSYKAIIKTLDGGAGSKEILLAGDVFFITSNSAILSNDGTQLYALSSSYFTYSGDPTIRNYRYTTIDLNNEQTILEATIPLHATTRFPNLYLKLHDNRLIVGDSLSGFHSSIDPITGQTTILFDTMAFDSQFEFPGRRVTGTLEYRGANSFISLGQDGVLRSWVTSTGNPIPSRLVKDMNGLSIQLETTPNNQYRILSGLSPIHLEANPSTTTAVENITNIPVEMPKETPLFFQAVEIATDTP